MDLHVRTSLRNGLKTFWKESAAVASLVLFRAFPGHPFASSRAGRRLDEKLEVVKGAGWGARLEVDRDYLELNDHSGTYFGLIFKKIKRSGTDFQV